MWVCDYRESARDFFFFWVLVVIELFCILNMRYLLKFINASKVLELYASTSSPKSILAYSNLRNWIYAYSLKAFVLLLLNKLMSVLSDVFNLQKFIWKWLIHRKLFCTRSGLYIAQPGLDSLDWRSPSLLSARTVGLCRLIWLRVPLKENFTNIPRIVITIWVKFWWPRINLPFIDKLLFSRHLLNIQTVQWSYLQCIVFPVIDVKIEVSRY